VTDHPSTRPSDPELDVRGLPKPDKHPTIFAAYAALEVGESFMLVNDHDPKHLRQEFDAALPGGFDWDYVNQQPRDWRIRITRLTAASPPTGHLDQPVAIDTDGYRSRPRVD
jgi:uncharacterized protein (DUF2249 family)